MIWLSIVGAVLVPALFWFCGWYDEWANGRPIWQFKNAMDEQIVAQQADQQEKIT